MPATSAHQRVLDAVRDGKLVFDQPVSRGGDWVVLVRDTTTGQAVERKFPSQRLALEWTASQLAGAQPHLTAARADLTRPRTGCSALDDDDGPSIADGLAADAAARRPDTSVDGPSGVEVSVRATNAAKKSGGFALRAVADVLESAGLDPTVEIVRVLQARRPVYRRDGSPAIDPETGEQATEPVLDPEVTAKTLLELQQYVKPKLKAVEVIDRTPPPNISDLDAAILGILAKGRAVRRGRDTVVEVIG